MLNPFEQIFFVYKIVEIRPDYYLIEIIFDGLILNHKAWTFDFLMWEGKMAVELIPIRLYLFLIRTLVKK